MATKKEVPTPRPGYNTVVGICGAVHLAFLYALLWIFIYTGGKDAPQPENWKNRPGAKFLLYVTSFSLVPLSLFALYQSVGKNISWKDWKINTGKWLQLQRGVMFLELVACDIAHPHLFPMICYTMAFNALAIIAMLVYRKHFNKKCEQNIKKSISNSK